VYVTVGRGVYAFSTSCDRSSCAPIWHAEQPNGVSSSAPVLGGGEVFVAGSSREGASFTAYPTSCRGTCAPSWRWLGRGGTHPSAPVYADGTVYVTEGTSQGTTKLLALAATCRTDGGTCAPEWAGSGDGDPIVSGETIYVASGGTVDAVLAYRTGCGSQGSTCTPAREYQGGTGRPVVSDGVLYAANGHDVVAFDLGCGEASCRPVWTGTVEGVVRSGPIVTDGAVYVGTSQGNVVAFKVGRNAAGGSGVTTAAVVAVLVLAMLVGVFAVRRRRMEFT
jgi:outer membrane protein assembly factor BamB